MRYAFRSDGTPFILAVMLDLNGDDTKYEDTHYKAVDTMERVAARNLVAGAAAGAATAGAIADGRLAPRLDRRTVEQRRKKGSE